MSWSLTVDGTALEVMNKLRSAPALSDGSSEDAKNEAIDFVSQQIENFGDIDYFKLQVQIGGHAGPPSDPSNALHVSITRVYLPRDAEAPVQGIAADPDADPEQQDAALEEPI